MNRLQFLLTKLAEEGSEISQIALKTSQFGLSECRPDQPLTNAERTHSEIYDLFAIIEMLNDEFNFGFNPDRKAIEAKKTKVEKYFEYSVSLGMIEK